MSDTLDDAEFWLPSQFLADDDDDVFAAKVAPKPKLAIDGPGLGFGLGFGSGSDWAVFSDQSSPLGSSESESDEEDFLAGLSLQMARSTLQDDEVFTNQKTLNLSGSPQSTLCTPIGIGCGCDHGSSRGSPTGSGSRVSSPPPPAAAPSPATWELLSAAAGEIAKIRTQEEFFFQKQLQFEHLRQQQILRQQQQQLQARRFQQMQMQKQQQFQQRHHQNGEFYGANKAVRPLGLPQSAWPPLQRQTSQDGSGMRAVFLGNQGPGKRECSGTGVFLPQVGVQPETRKKQGCSTVLVPARVVQALNLNLDDMQTQVQPRFNGRFIPENDVALRLRANNNNNTVSYQKRNVRVQQQVNHEIRLPQDWTY